MNAQKLMHTVEAIVDGYLADCAQAAELDVPAPQLAPRLTAWLQGQPDGMAHLNDAAMLAGTYLYEKGGPSPLDSVAVDVATMEGLTFYETLDVLDEILADTNQSRDCDTCPEDSCDECEWVPFSSN